MLLDDENKFRNRELSLSYDSLLNSAGKAMARLLLP